jgi:L-ascorbate metabolism protein UlaG (beta-lactamase superfamily)
MHRKIVLLAIALAASSAWAKDFVSPDQIVYDMVPGFGAQGGTEVLEWERKSVSGSGEPAVTATIEAPRGLRLRWLGTAGFEISDDETSILVDPFVSRPTAFQALGPLDIDVEAVDKYVTEPMVRSGSLNKLKAILVSHTHIDHVQDVPYVLSKFPKAMNRPLVAGDKNLACLLKAYNGREKEISWLKGIDPLKSGPQKIFDFDKKKKLTPPPNQKLGIPVGTFGKFTITAYISEHGLYDDIPFTLEGGLSGKAPLTGLQYKAYLNSSMTYLIEYTTGSGNAKRTFRIFAADSARFLHPAEVSREVMQGGPVDLLLEGIASRKKENMIPQKIDGFMPKYFIPTHYDNFFVSFDKFRTFDFAIKETGSDNSQLKQFIETFCGPEIHSPCPKLRMMKMFYYYSLEKLLS